MTTIKRLTCFDLSKIDKLVECLGYDDNSRFQHELKNEAVTVINRLLPLKYKFMPESFILSDNDEILGLITTSPTYGNPYKIRITKLIFQNNLYEAGQQLVEFVIARYGAKGAQSFLVEIDQSQIELINLFIHNCGFRQCSYENLWKLDNFKAKTQSKSKFRYCQNSDAREIAKLFNSGLNSLYKPSMEKIKNEYFEPIFGGMTNFYKNRYVLEINNKIISYLSITTEDNINYIFDILLNDAYQVSYDEILNFAINEVSLRKSNFNAFIRHRQYMKNADQFEEYLHERNLSCIQTKAVLVKDFYKPIKQSENMLEVFLGENKFSSSCQNYKV